MVARVQRRVHSRPGRGPLMPPAVHRIWYDTEMVRGVEMTRAVCVCGRYASVRWSLPSRAELSGAAHVYAMAFPRGPVIPRNTRAKGSESHGEAITVRAYGKCYLHGEDSPCGCLRGCTGCTGCYCSCACVGG